jgi:adenylate cyclase
MTRTLVARADDDEQLPQLRAGIAAGEALHSGGDWYGRPVNLAARITAVAEPGQVLGDAEIAARASDGFEWQPRGSQRFKGIEDEVALYTLA